MLIAIDTAGGEYAPHEIVKGAIKAAQEYEVEIALVGSKSILHVLSSRYSKKVGLTIFEAIQTIELHESPVQAVRSKPDSSIVVGINLVRDGQASAFVSAGNSGAVLCAALLNLQRLEGVDRPALGSIINIIPSTPTLLIDVGANVDCRPHHLVQFGQLGAAYMAQLFGISRPRIGLLNNGEEETKGNRLLQQSYQLLKKTDLNFVGNVEGHDILKGTADVIVTDGFTGNIVLKTIEGLNDTFLSSLLHIGHIFSSAYRLPARALHRDIGMDSWSKRLDYREYGGACLLGVRGTVIISHGRSQAKAIKNAIGLAKRTVERGTSEKVKEESDEQTD